MKAMSDGWFGANDGLTSLTPGATLVSTLSREPLTFGRSITRFPSCEKTTWVPFALQVGSFCIPIEGTAPDGFRVAGLITLIVWPLSYASCGEPLEMIRSTRAPLATLEPAAGTVPAT